MARSSKKTFRKDSISVAFMVRQLRETVGLTIDDVNTVDATEQRVSESNLHRPGLTLAGYTKLYLSHTHRRVQVLGNTESEYLHQHPSDQRRDAFAHLLEAPPPCIFLTDNNSLDDELVAMATGQGVPIYCTPLPSTDFMAVLRDFLNDQFAVQQSIHGSLVDVYGIGLILIGQAGIGKSEVSLDLVERGHRLVADDVVIVTRKEEQVLMGAGTDLVQHFMEVRGLGLIDVRAMFGVRAIRFQKRVEVVVQLELWDPEQEYTRIGMVDEDYDILGVQLPLVRLPVTPGKNVTVLCEVIAMNYLLRHYGYDPAEVFSSRLADRIRQKKEGGLDRGVQYFEHDYE